MSVMQTNARLWMSLPLAVGLAIDAAVVATGISASLPAVTRRHAFRLSWHFGLFQFLMPLIGWLLGKQAAGYIDGWDHWVAFGLLAAVGGHMVLAAIKGGPPDADKNTAQSIRALRDPTRGWSLVVLSIGTSLDALAVGLVLPLLHVSIWAVVPVIGIVTSLMVLLGMFAGRVAGAIFGGTTEILGGLVLIGMGVRILIQGFAGIG